MNESLTEFIFSALAGTIAGVTGVAVGSPLDVVKTRIQVQTAQNPDVSHPSLFRILRDIVKHEGPRGLFKGSIASSLGQAPNNFIIFGVNGSVLSWLQRTYPSTALTSHSGKAGDPMYIQLYLAGCCAGFLQSFALAPFELVKVKQQMNLSASGRSSLLSTAQNIIKERGIKGLTIGTGATLLRDAPTFGIYFSSFELTKHFLTPVGSSEPPVWAVLCAGGVSGPLSWCLAIPFDVIKSIIQASPIERGSKIPRIRDAATLIYRTHGLKGFFTGLGPILVRSVPVNAVTFFVYETCMNWRVSHDDYHVM